MRVPRDFPLAGSGWSVGLRHLCGNPSWLERPTVLNLGRVGASVGRVRPVQGDGSRWSSSVLIPSLALSFFLSLGASAPLGCLCRWLWPVRSVASGVMGALFLQFGLPERSFFLACFLLPAWRQERPTGEVRGEVGQPPCGVDGRRGHRPLFLSFFLGGGPEGAGGLPPSFLRLCRAGFVVPECALGRMRGRRLPALFLSCNRSWRLRRSAPPECCAVS